MNKKLVIIIVLGVIVLSCTKIFMHNKSDDIVKLQFSSWGSETEVSIIKPMISDFEEQNPKIKIDFMHIPQNYFQKLHLLFASNTAPDVIFMNNLYLPIYANAGVLEDLTNYSFDYKNFYPKSLEALSYKGKIYAIPRDISNLVIFYNKDLFKKYNISYPQSGWTYNQFLDLAIKLTHRPDVFGVSFEDDPFYFLPYLMLNGGWPKEDTEKYFKEDVLRYHRNLKGLKQYADLRLKYHVAPLKTESASATMAQMFLQQKIAMHLSGRWLVPKYRQEAKFDWDIIEFPKARTQSQSVVPMDASGWCVSKSSKHKKEAVKFISYMSNNKNSEKFAQSGLIVPARIDSANSKFFLDGNKPVSAKIFLQVAQTSVPTPVTTNYKEILDSLKSRTEYMLNSK